MTIEIVAYNPDWIHIFEDEKELLLTLFGSRVIIIEHIGSTAIPHQHAKPIIDLFIGVSPFQELAFYSNVLNPKEYFYMATGMTGRYLFQKYIDGIWTHNLHILSYDEEFYIRNEILFRDYLRTHPELVVQYGELKRQLMVKYGLVEEYTRAKTGFIQTVIDSARKERGLPSQNVWE